jgi:hypothetical protein
VPSTRISEWLPQIAHFNIFVHAHKNANEPATVAELRQQFVFNLDIATTTTIICEPEALLADVIAHR